MNGYFVISLDFEKYWGVRDNKTIQNYRENLTNVDHIIEKMLKIFNDNQIHATWAIVGFLFFDNKNELYSNLPGASIYKDKNLDPYEYIKKNDLAQPYHFAKQCILKIHETAHQEIASHTFSHYYCLEEGQNIEDFRDDCKRFNEVSKNMNISVSTIIFPRNQVNDQYEEILIENQITAYRGNEKNRLNNNNNKKDYLRKIKRMLRFLDRYINITGHNTFVIEKKSKIVNVQSSRFLEPYKNKLKLFNRLKLHRIKKSMSFAAKNNEIYHLWWHPHNFGQNLDKNFQMLFEIISHYKKLEREFDFKSKNINELVKEL